MMTVYPTVIETVKRLNIQQHSHGIIQHVGNAGYNYAVNGAARRILFSINRPNLS